MAQPSCCMDDIYKIMRDCWKYQPKKRPSFSELAGKLEEILIETANTIYLTVELPPIESPSGSQECICEEESQEIFLAVESLSVSQECIYENESQEESISISQDSMCEEESEKTHLTEESPINQECETESQATHLTEECPSIPSISQESIHEIESQETHSA